MKKKLDDEEVAALTRLSSNLHALGLEEIIKEELQHTNRDSEAIILDRTVVNGVIDFSDIDELAEDEEDIEAKEESSNLNDFESDVSMQSSVYKIEDIPKEQLKFSDLLALSIDKKPRHSLRRLKKRFLDLKQSAIPMISDRTFEFLSWQVGEGTLPPKASNKYRLVLSAQIRKPLRVTKILDALGRFDHRGSPSKAATIASNIKVALSANQLCPLNLIDWESNILISPTTFATKPKPRLTPLYTEQAQGHSLHDVHRVRNRELESDKWLEAIIIDPGSIPEAAIIANTRLQIPLGDPFLQFDIGETESLHSKLNRAEKLIADRLRKLRKQQSGQESPAIINAASLASNADTLQVNYSRCLSSDKFNVSCDRFYEKRRKKLGVVHLVSGITKSTTSGSNTRRTTLGGPVQHSIPAIKLLSPFFMTMLSVYALRHFHHVPLEPLGMFINSLKSSVNNMSLSSSRSAVIKNSHMLTLSDSEPFLLLEYSEERPLFVSNPGMALQVIHYYRKTNPKDIYTPSSDIGIVCCLEPTDPSPFPGAFGDVPHGQIVPALVCGMFKAPLFFHTSEEDFVLCMQIPKEGEGDANFSLCPITNLLVVGQQLPLQAVPTPNSRTLNTYYHSRCQLVAHRSFNKNVQSIGEPVMRITRMYSVFPQISEGSLRKWCKEFSDVQRGGKDGGIWRRLDDVPAMNEEQLRQLVTPEMVCLAESTMAAQQLVADARYIRSLLNIHGSDLEEVDEEADEDAASSQADTAPDSTSKTSRAQWPEVRYSPWILSSNFISACQGKCFLDLTGPGDPTGFGAGFSFFRLPTRLLQTQRMFAISHGSSGSVSPRPLSTPTTTTGTNAPNTLTTSTIGASLKFMAEQSPSQSYRNDIHRIWEAQWSWLTNQQTSAKESILPSKAIPFAGLMGSMVSTQPEVPAKRSVTIKNGQIINGLDQTGNEEEDENNLVHDFAHFLKRPPTIKKATTKHTQILVIERLLQQPDGQQTIERQRITDPLVIAAYCRERPLYNPQRSERHLDDRPIIISKKRKQRITPKEKAREPVIKISIPSKKDINIRCGSCGQIGHMRTNRVCPRYADYEEEVRKDLLRAADLPLEQVGLRIEDGKISITKASLERIDAAHKQQLHITIPKKIPQPSPSQVAATERRQHRLSITSQMADLMLEIVDTLIVSPEAWPFIKPVSKKKYPIYYRLVAKPRDLGTIQKKLQAQQQMTLTSSRSAHKFRPRYAHSTDFMADIELLASNCLQFNGPEHPFTLMSLTLRDTARRMYDERKAQLDELEAQL